MLDPSQLDDELERLSFDTRAREARLRILATQSDRLRMEVLELMVALRNLNVWPYIYGDSALH